MVNPSVAWPRTRAVAALRQQLRLWAEPRRSATMSGVLSARSSSRGRRPLASHAFAQRPAFIVCTIRAVGSARPSPSITTRSREGVPPLDVLGGGDVSLDALQSPSTLISRHQLIQCYRNAVALSRNPHLPYTIGSSVHLSAYGMYGYAMLCSTDFRRTMEFAVRYHQLAFNFRSPLAYHFAQLLFRLQGGSIRQT